MDIRKILAKNLQRLRYEKKVSQEELGFAAEIDRTYISGLERGVRNPSILVLQRVAVALDVKVADLLKG